jgi:hypothetical protein
VTARVLKHTAEIARCWFIRHDGDLFFGIIESRAHGEEARTASGPLTHVLETIENLYAHRGLPVCRFTVTPAGSRRVA